MTLKLIGTCYSQVTDQERGFRAVIEVNEEYRLSRRWFGRERECMCYGKRLFYRLAKSGRWELVSKEREAVG